MTAAAPRSRQRRCRRRPTGRWHRLERQWPRHATTAALVLLRNVAFYAFVAWLLGHGGAFIYVLLPAVYTSRKVCCRVTAAWPRRVRRVTTA
mgnify:CR=1 FL=1